MKTAKIFVGSSSEGLSVAEALKIGLEATCDCEVDLWSEDFFRAGNFTLDSLIDQAPSFDFAILVATPDDNAVIRGTEAHVPRDNILFELGLFMGVLGRKRAFVLFPQDRAPKLPTDLLGVTYLRPYKPRSDGRFVGALTAAIRQVADAIATDGIREERSRTEGTTAAAKPLPAAAASSTPGQDSDHQDLQHELDVLEGNARAQGWSCKRTTSAVRVTSPRGKKLTLALPKDPRAARRKLRPFMSELRAHGLRVNSHLREPVD